MTAKTRANFKTDKDTAFADNTAGDIGADDLRAQMDHLADSALFPEDSVPSHSHAAGDLTSGTLADARVAESNVTQHEGALTITESQISDLGSYLTGIGGQSIGALSDVSISSPSNGQVLKHNGTNWVNGTDSGGGSVEGTAILSTGETGGSKFLREDGDGTSSWQAIPGGGDALTGSPLSQFAATTSAQLAGVISDETGSGALVFGTSPTLTTPNLGTPSAVVLTNATGLPTAGLLDDAVTRAKIADAAMSGADATLITGTAGTAGNTAQWNADGDLVDGAPLLSESAVSAKATPVAADRFPIFDSEAGEAYKTVAYSVVATSTANVTAAGALMDSEVSSLSGVKTLTVPDSTTISTFGATLVDDADSGAARTTLGVVIGTDVQAYDADTLKADTSDDLTVGYTQTSNNIGTVSSGTTTLAFSASNIQRLVNNGAFTLAPPSTGEGVITLRIENDTSAGAITTSGWDSVTGDAFDTTDNNVFLCSCVVVNGESWLIVNAAEGNT